MNKHIQFLCQETVLVPQEQLLKDFARAIVADCIQVLDEIYDDVKVLDPVDSADKDVNTVMMTTLKIAKRRILERLY